MKTDKNKILEIFESKLDHIIKLPAFKDLHEWNTFIVSKFKREDIIDAFNDIIEKYESKLPIPFFDIEEVKRQYIKFLSDDCKRFLIKKEHLDQLDISILEKIKYENNFKKTGLGLIQYERTYNQISNIFHQDIRLKCSGYDAISVMSAWENKKNRYKILSPLFRMGLWPSKTNYWTASKVGSHTYVASQFKPYVAKLLYDDVGAKSILDTSCGWGDRLAGFWSSPKAEIYHGYDPNPEVFEKYKEQCIQYSNWSGEKGKFKINRDSIFNFVTKNKEVTIWRSPAEDVTSFPNTYDLYFTSPPYFSTERYNEHGKFETEQSWSRYNTFDDWYNKFFLFVTENAWKALTPNGVMMININDPIIKNKRYEMCDDMISRYQKHFIGQIGMRMILMPRKIENLKELKSKFFIEPIWVFSKGNKYEFGQSIKTLSEFLV